MDTPGDRIINVSALKRAQKQLGADIVAFLTAKISEIERDFGVQAKGVYIDTARVAEIGVQGSRTVVRGAAVEFTL